MKDAIQKAIEGGYTVNGHPLRWEEKTKSWWYYWMSEDEEGNTYEASNPACLEHPHYFWGMVSQPLFWQALGKSLGWGTTDNCWGCGYDEGATDNTPEWVVNWHHFIDHLSEGKDTGQFFIDLLK